MATGRSSSSLVSCSRASSTAHDQTSLASDIELVTLVATVDNAVSEHSRRSSSIDLDATRRSTAAAAYPTRIQTTTLRGEASSLQSDNPPWIRRLILDTWLCEWAAMCFSIGCLVAIVVVVSVFDGEKLPLAQLHGLTLNAIISVLSNAARAGLIFVVSASMGQLKWCWLRKSSRQIQDIQAMDDASRGPLGAFGVLMFWTGGSLAALGSIITLLMIAFGPFLQLLVAYPSRDAIQPGAFALAPRNIAYTHHLPPKVEGAWYVDPSPWEDNTELFGVLEAGVWADPKPFDQEPTCSTGRCSWPRFQSVGWCSKCEDRTDSATINNCMLGDVLKEDMNVSDRCILDLGHGANFSLFRDIEVTEFNANDTRHKVTYTSEVIWPLSYGNYGYNVPGVVTNTLGLPIEPETVLGVLNPLITIGHATVERDVNVQLDQTSNALQIVEANQCILHPCEKQVSVTKANGTTTWNVDLTNFGNLVVRDVPFDYPHPGGRTTLCWQAEDGDMDLVVFSEENYAADSSKRAFCPLEDYAYEIQKSLRGQYDQQFTVEIDNNDDYWPVGLETPDQNSDQYKYGRFSTIGPKSTRNFSERVENIAVALTNWGLQTTNDTWSGDAYADESFVRVRWHWIVLPAFLELASLVLLVLTIIHSRRMDIPLWKSSVLALIYHGVDELRAQENPATERWSSMEGAAKEVDVQLVKSEDGVNSLSKRSGYRPVDQDG
jgi:hypothetical protein